MRRRVLKNLIPFVAFVVVTGLAGAQSAGAQGTRPPTRAAAGPIDAVARPGGSPSADPDQPALGSRVGAGTYLRLREHQIDLYRGFPFNLPYNARERAIRQFDREQAAERPGAAVAWTSLGPNPIPNGQVAGGATNIPVSGRVTAIAVNPSNPDVVYVGTAQGGLYRSLDGGTTWTPLMDNADSLAIGAVTIDPTNTSTVFVGTGEGNLSLDSYSGVGLYRITNADQVTPTVSGPFETRVAGTGTAASNGHAFFGTSITSIAVDPNNDNRIFVGNTIGGIGVSNDPLCCGITAGGAFIGLYFSSNALATTPTFSRVDGLPGSGVAGVTDLAFQPGSSDNLLVGSEDLGGGGTSGIYRTTNASAASSGTSGTSPTFTSTFDFSTHPQNIKFAINKVSSTTTVLAALEENNGELWKSTDDGATWPTQLTAANGFCGGQCFYDIGLAIDPATSSKIYIGGSADPQSPSGPFPTQFALSTNGGTSFTRSDTNLHADTHAIAIAPSSTSTIYTGDDGGIFKSTNSGGAWSSLNNTTFLATQFDSVAVHPTDPNFMIGGSQDNGTEFFRPNQTWTRADFGDGGFSAIDQNAADTTNVTMYHTYFNQTNNLIGFARVTSTTNAHDGGWFFLGCSGNTSHNGIGCSNSVLFYPPLALGPGTPNTVYFGTDRLYRSTNSGTNNTVVSQAPIESGKPISAIGISRQNDNVRIVGLVNGDVYRTTTGSSTLGQVTGPWKAKYVARAIIDPNNSNVAYVALDGFMGGTTSGDSHVWTTTNLGNASPTWTAINSGLPDVPVNAFAVNPADSTHLFAGTDVGVFSSTNSGTNWAPLGTGLPKVAVFDMAVASDGSGGETLRIATHGKGMWQIPISAGGSGFSLTVNKNGTGKGTVTSGDGFINCGTTCSHTYASATNVTLTATPVTGAQFVSWTNCDVPSGNTCTMHAGTANKTVTATFNDVTPPHVTMTAPTKPFQTSSTVHVAWTASDTGGSGLKDFDVLFKDAPFNTSSFSSFQTVTGGPFPGTARSVNVTFGGNPAGLTFCFVVRAHDNAGLASKTTIAPKCTELPIDDNQFGTHPGFTQKTGQTGYYHKTVSVATAKGSNIAGGGIHAKHLAVLVTKCNGCGTIQVFFGGTAVGNPISLQNSTTVKQVLVLLPAFSSVKTGTVVVKVTTSGKRVEIDGVGTSLV